MKKTKFLHFYFLLCALPFSTAQNFTPGQSYFGNKNYVEYIAGNFPIILSAPHGGLLIPAEIPDRDCPGCVYVTDFNTQELARALSQAVFEQTGCYPYVILNRLHRRKMDANRDLPEAADGDTTAGRAWSEFQDFIETAKNSVFFQFGKGFYVDLHGHAHTEQRLELGYLLTKTELQLPADTLNLPKWAAETSIRNLVLNNAGGRSHAELLRGETSLGNLLAVRGYPATPSFPDPFPEGAEPYFNGGYNTARHGSFLGGKIDGVQIECNGEGVRNNLSQVNRFADSLAVGLVEYLKLHYFGNLPALVCKPSGDDLIGGAMPEIEIFPNPFCRSFRVNYTGNDSNFSAEILDFNGKSLFIKDLQPGMPLEISPSPRQNLFVLIRKNGQVVGGKVVLFYCR